MLKYVTVRFILIALAVVIVDFAIKCIIAETFSVGEIVGTANGLLSVGRIPNMRMSLGLQSTITLLDILSVTFKLAMVVLFIRIQMVNVGKFLKVSSSLIVIGWFGIILDRLILANGMSNYIHMDYFCINGVMNYFLNLSSLMTTIGYILFVVALIVHRKDIKRVFRK